MEWTWSSNWQLWAWGCQLSQSVHFCLINTTRFFSKSYFGFGSNHMYYDFVGNFLQSAFHPCYLGRKSSRLCLENFPVREDSPHQHFHIFVTVLSHVLIFYLSYNAKWSPNSLHWPYCLSPDVISSVTHVFILLFICASIDI